MGKDWHVSFNAETSEWIAYEITGLLSVGKSKRFDANQKQAAIEYAETMAGENNVFVNGSTESVEGQWRRMNSSAVNSQTQSNACYPFNQPGWTDQSQQKKII